MSYQHFQDESGATAPTTNNNIPNDPYYNNNTNNPNPNDPYYNNPTTTINTDPYYNNPNPNPNPNNPNPTAPYYNNPTNPNDPYYNNNNFPHDPNAKIDLGAPPPPSPSFPLPSAPEEDVREEERELVIRSFPAMTREETSRAILLPLSLPREHPGGRLSGLVSEQEHGEYVDAVNEVGEKQFEKLEKMQKKFLVGMVVLVAGYVVLTQGVLRLFLPPLYYAIAFFGLLALGLAAFFVLLWYRNHAMKKASKKVLKKGNKWGKERFFARGVLYQLNLEDKTRERKWRLNITILAGEEEQTNETAVCVTGPDDLPKTF